ncbi:MAG TPA: fused MFS/spermidine synthase, partial [Candidatus Xenobia bacterium]
RGSNVGAGVGQVYAANTLGAILGSLLVGFWILPRLGVQASCGVLSALLLGAGLLTLRYTRQKPILLPGAVAVLVGVYLTLPGDLLVQQAYQPLYRDYFGLTPGSLRYFREDPYGAVAVGQQHDGYLRLIVDSVSQMGTEINGQRYARLMAHLPLVLQPEARRALVICFGTGTTVGAASTHSNVLTDCAELSPGVLGAAPLFGAVNERVWTRPNVHLVVDDGRHMLRNAGQYDVITAEPPTPTARGMVNLFSADYYRLCRDHLTEHGMVCQGIPLPALGDDQVRLVIRAFQEVFPDCSIWEGSPTHLILLGSKAPLALDPAHLAPGFADPSARRSLAEVGIDSPATLLATFLHGPTFLRAYCGDIPLVDDDHPYIEYAWNDAVPLNPELGHHRPAELWPMIHGFDQAEIAARAAALDDLKHLGNPSGGPDHAVQYLLQVRRITAALPDNPFVLWWTGLQGFALQGSPPSLQAAQAEAFNLLMLHRDREARDILARLAVQAPREPMGHLCLGVAELGLGHPAAARQSFDRGLAIFPEGAPRQSLAALLQEAR